MAWARARAHRGQGTFFFFCVPPWHSQLCQRSSYKFRLVAGPLLARRSESPNRRSLLCAVTHGALSVDPCMIRTCWLCSRHSRKTDTAQHDSTSEVVSAEDGSRSTTSLAFAGVFFLILASAQLQHLPSRYLLKPVADGGCGAKRLVVAGYGPHDVYSSRCRRAIGAGPSGTATGASLLQPRPTTPR